MKKNKLIPIIGLSAIAGITAPITTLAACANQNNTYTNQAIDEFIGNNSLGIRGITSCPRPGGSYSAIIPYLKERAMKIAQLSPNEIHEDESHNLYFDIPATAGFENKDTIILQGHTDMIVAGLTKSQALTTPIDAVVDVENETIHSRDFKTSLGADNGIGLSIALTLIKNRDKYNHPKIRVLMTADEDSGMIGASKLDPSWLKDGDKPIKWLLNIDAEEEGYIYNSCAGNSRSTISQTYHQPTSEEALGNEFTLTISGLLGGHSALDIVKNHANSDRLVYEFFYAINNDNPNCIQIVSHNHLNEKGEDIEYSQNQIIANSKVVFKTSLTIEQINAIWTAQIERWKNVEQYKNESWEEVKSKSGIVANTTKSEHFLSKSDSINLIKLMGDYTMNPQAQTLTSFYYGVLAYHDELKTYPKSSINLGPVNIEFKDTTANLRVGTSTRSSIGDQHSTEQYSINWLNTQYENICQNFNVAKEQGPKYYPWKKDDNNQLVKYFKEGYESLGITPVIYDDLGGVEPAWWTQKSDGATTCACVGPRIDGAHSVNETLYIKTIEPCIKNLLFAINKIINR